MDGGDGEMTLAFDLAALEALSDPAAVFTDARQWTEYVGVVSERPTYVVTNFTRKHRVRQDFFSGPRGVEESLESVHEQFDTDRHVYVGTDEDHRSAAAATDWEYLSVEEAAEAAGWELGEANEEPDAFEEGTRDDWP
jgi:hypothetical protein